MSSRSRPLSWEPIRRFRRAGLIVIVVLVGAATAMMAVHGWLPTDSPKTAEPIVLISIDTLRADHVGAYGYRKVPTPNIDALAADGVLFERAYSHVPLTLPAHTSILSGRLPYETSVRDNIGFAVRPGERLLPEMLRERRYSTGGVVSAYVLRKETGISQGFDFFDGEMPPSSPELNIGEVQRDGTESEAIAERWLEARDSSRVFLFLHLYEPHKPYTPPARFAKYAPYDGEIGYADEIVGRLVQYLKSHQLYERSTIVLLSDHGEGLGDHGEQEHGLFVYDEAIHVPLIIKRPKALGAGRRIHEVVQHIDLVPTLLDLARMPIPADLHGRSLRPLLDGAGRLAEQAIYSESLYARYHFGWSELTALTEDRYRYIKAPRDELYDLARDPHERTNIAEDRGPAQQTRQALRGALARLVGGMKIQAPSGVSAEDRERLQALGYVGARIDMPAAPDGELLPDPKDKREVLETYRAAVDLAGERKWGQAVALLRQILSSDSEMADVWEQLALFAIRAGRYDQAIDGYRHAIELRPSDAAAYIGAAEALLKLERLDEATRHAELAARMGREHESRLRVSAHVLLARIALARHDALLARQEAERVHEIDQALAMPAYIEARLLHDEGKYSEALPLFDRAIAALQQSRGTPIPELHFYAADTLGRLERYPEAEARFVEELRYFPQNTRARAGLAMLYQATGRPDAAARVIADLTHITPTPESYALAARLWTMFGNAHEAKAIRAEARRTFAETGTSGAHRARQ